MKRGSGLAIGMAGGSKAGWLAGLCGVVGVGATASQACYGTVGDPSNEPSGGGAGGASTPTGVAGSAAGGLGTAGHGGGNGTGAAGGAGAGGGSTTCQPDCTTLGERACNAGDTAVLQCTDVGTAGAPCLQWQLAEDCNAGETCRDGTCVGCCTTAGTGCCTGDYSADCCAEADACLMLSIRNGSELCDDGRRNVDPTNYRYFLICLNDRQGIGYAAHNSGPPCGNPTIARCQCWEQQGIAPWDQLQTIEQITCDASGKRVEVSFPSAGAYYVGVHPPPGSYNLTGYCPTGPGCMTCVGLLEIPR